MPHSCNTAGRSVSVWSHLDVTVKSIPNFSKEFRLPHLRLKLLRRVYITTATIISRVIWPMATWENQCVAISLSETWCPFAGLLCIHTSVKNDLISVLFVLKNMYFQFAVICKSISTLLPGWPVVSPGLVPIGSQPSPATLWSNYANFTRGTDRACLVVAYLENSANITIFNT